MYKSLSAFAINIAVAGITAGFAPVAAQNFDPNLVNRLESFIPEPEPTAIPRETITVPVTSQRTSVEPVPERVAVPLPQQQAEFTALPLAVQEEQLQQFLPSAEGAQLIAREITPDEALATLSDKQKGEVFRGAGIEDFRTRVFFKSVTKTVTTYKKRELSPKVVATLYVNSGYGYQSNASQDAADIADEIAQGNATFSLKVPVGTKDDNLALSIGPTVVRYAKLDDDSSDLLTGQANYVRVLPKRFLSAHRTSGTATQDFITVGARSFSSYTPGFEAMQIHVFTPSLQWERKNVPVGKKICGARGEEKYCYFANVRATVSNDWTTISTSDKAQGVFGLTLGWNTPIKNLVLTAGAALTGRLYHNVRGGREDLVVVPDMGASWTPNANVNLSVGTSYTDQNSTFAPAAWDGFAASPNARLTVKF
jgi:hypothetical protein